MELFLADVPALSALHTTYENLTKLLLQKGLTITFMESCTSGFLASLITDTEGSSGAFRGSFVTYANETKILEGVPAEIIETYGVYSQETACAMAETARNHFSADLALGITGSLTGTDPANSDSVSGEIWLHGVSPEKSGSVFLRISGGHSRFDTKLQTAEAAARLIAFLLDDGKELL